MSLTRIGRVVAMFGGILGAIVALVLFGVFALLWFPLAPLIVSVGGAIIGACLAGAAMVTKRPHLGGGLLLLPVPLLLWIGLHTIFFQNLNGGGGILFGPAIDLAVLGVPSLLLIAGGTLAWIRGYAPQGSRLADDRLNAGHGIVTLVVLVVVVGTAIFLIEPEPAQLRGTVLAGQRPLGDAQVVASIRIGRVPWKPAAYRVVTDAEGRFELELPRGRWELKVTHAGYREHTELRYIVDEGVVERRIALLRAP